MRLPPQETARFYRIWFALLHYVNAQLQLVPAFPVKCQLFRLILIVSEPACLERSSSFANESRQARNERKEAASRPLSLSRLAAVAAKRAQSGIPLGTFTGV